jgi:hypothetical protein
MPRRDRLGELNSAASAYQVILAGVCEDACCPGPKGEGVLPALQDRANVRIGLRDLSCLLGLLNRKSRELDRRRFDEEWVWRWLDRCLARRRDRGDGPDQETIVPTIAEFDAAVTNVPTATRAAVTAITGTGAGNRLLMLLFSSFS